MRLKIVKILIFHKIILKSQDLFADLDVELYGLKSSITPDIEAADLIVGHAGAGTCLEVLKARKPLIVVTNDTLMDNHQMELSRALTAQGVVRSCYVSDLSRAISTLHPKTLKQITAGHPEIFQAELDALMGYSTATS